MGFFDFRWFFELFNPLRKILFPLEETRQTPRAGFFSNSRGFRQALQQRQFASAMRSRARRPGSHNSALPVSGLKGLAHRKPGAGGLLQSHRVIQGARPSTGGFGFSRPQGISRPQGMNRRPMAARPMHRQLRRR